MDEFYSFKDIFDSQNNARVEIETFYRLLGIDVETKKEVRRYIHTGNLRKQKTVGIVNNTDGTNKMMKLSSTINILL